MRADLLTFRATIPGRHKLKKPIATVAVWFGAFALSAIAVVLCVAYVDRPLAVFFSKHTAQTRIANFLDPLITPRKLGVAALLMVAWGSGVQALRGRTLTRLPRALIVCGLSAVVAVAVELTLKKCFGRGDPFPTYLQDHAYGFDWLQGRLGWASFPSGTAIVSTAIAATLKEYPRSRLAAFIAAACLSLLVVVLNYHWFSDVVAGAFLGISIGLLIDRAQASLK